MSLLERSGIVSLRPGRRDFILHFSFVIAGSYFVSVREGEVSVISWIVLLLAAKKAIDELTRIITKRDSKNVSNR